jgi:glucose/arabinose dehydrogenase
LNGGDGTGGADGFTFLLQNDPEGAGAIANAGGSLGYDIRETGAGTRITQSLAIEFDTYQNGWDSNNNHISVLRDGDVSTPLTTTLAPIDLNGGSLINAWVDYNGSTNRLEVFLSTGAVKPTTPTLVQTIDLAAVVGNQAYLGFTAGTGGLTNAQDITNWDFTSTAPPIGQIGTGLRAEYFDNVDFTNPVLTRTDATVNFSWGSGSPAPNIGADTFSVVWSGQVEAAFSETYTFFTNTDDGVRLFVNDQLIIDRFVDQSPTEVSGTIALVAGQRYNIRMEYYENAGGAVAQLRWASPSQAKQIIPQARLFDTPIAPPAATNGLRGEYFNNIDFTAPVLTRTDRTINYNWGPASPDPRIGVDTFSVRWTGQVLPTHSSGTQTYTFFTTSDDGVRLFVDNQLVIDNFRDQSPTERSGTIALEAGRRYDIRMEYYENGGGAVAQLAWSSPTQPKQIIPFSQLFLPPAPSSGVFSVGDTAVTVNEDGAVANIRVNRTEGSAGRATLDFTTSDGSALAGEDYTARSGTLVFEDGVTSQVISVPILEDTLIEGNEFFGVSVDNPIGATLRAPRTSQVTIVDDDVPPDEDFTLSFPNFSSAGQLQLNGNAAVASNILRLTPAATNQAGSAFFRDILAIDGNTSFQTQFQFRLSGGSGASGADGLMFMLQDTSGGNQSLGGTGGSLGYGGTGPRSIGVKFDTFDNGLADPSGNFVGIVRDGDVATTLANAPAPFDLNSGAPLNAWIDYNGATDRLEIFLSNTIAKPSTPLLAQTLDLTAIVGTNAYIGFSAGTGGLFNNQDIENWRFASNGSPPSIGFSPISYIVDETAGTATVTVRRGINVSANAASVNYATSNGTATAGADYTAVSGVLNFAPGDTEESFTIAITNDTLVERDETIRVTLSSPVGAILGSNSAATVTIRDEDTGSFAVDTVVTGLTLPTAFEWEPGSDRLYIAEKAGIVRVFENGVLSPTPFINIADEVNSNGLGNDRGLLGLTIHPNFPTTPYIYLGYTYDPPEAATGTGLAARDQNGNRPSRVIRVTADAATGFRTAVPGSAVVILGTNSNWAFTSGPDINSTDNIDLPPSGIIGPTITAPPGTSIDGNGNIRDYLATDSTSHTIGDLEFGLDGFLYVSNGDGTSFGRVDPRTRRVQDLNNLSGKLLRIDPITGAGVADNPFFQSTDPFSNQSKVYSLGLRNPFRMAINPTTGEPFIGDVGWTQWEEINTGRGQNFGWPYYEGGNGVSLQTGGYSELPEAPAFYQNTTVVAPLYAVSENATAIIAGDFYSGTTFPSVYQGGLFFSDSEIGRVEVLLFNPDGTVNTVKRFASGTQFRFISQMSTGRDSNLYFSGLLSGTIQRWRPV